MAIYHVPVMVEFGTFITVDATNPESAKNEARRQAEAMICGSTTSVYVSCEDPEAEEE